MSTSTFVNSTLRILNRDGKTIGTGFLITRDLIVTCAHVVTAGESIDGDTVQVQFTGHSEKFFALVEPKLWRDVNKGDVAFLRLESVPDGIEPIRLGLAEQSRPGNLFHSFGYATAASKQGIGARGEIITLLPDKTFLQIRAHEANHGMSGAPVFDEDRSLVVGMITEGHTELGRNSETTFAIPCEQLFEICVELQTPVDSLDMQNPDMFRNYLEHVIQENQYLHLHGISVGNQPIIIPLEKVYLPLRVVEQKNDEQADFKLVGDLLIENLFLSNRKIVIIGDPGCGKTTLLSYLAVTYAKSFPIGSIYVPKKDELQDKLNKLRYENSNLSESEFSRLTDVKKINSDLRKVEAELKNTLLAQRMPTIWEESDCLPIFLPLRNLGNFIKQQSTVSSVTPAIFLEYISNYFAGLKLPLSINFADHHLENGKAILLFDGMDEIADTAIRQQVARLIEDFCRRFPECRYIVTSRVTSYKGVSRIGEAFSLAKVRDFSMEEARKFVRDWTFSIEAAIAKKNDKEVQLLAEKEASDLIQIIDSNQNVAELAVNPLLLTVITLIYRYKAKLPDHRYELYDEAIKVLLGQWDQAKGLTSVVELFGIVLDLEDQRKLLEPIAFWMQENKQREIESDDLRPVLVKNLRQLDVKELKLDRAVDNFLHFISERSGLINEKTIGIYGFSHQTFQEYLAARELVKREDSTSFAVKILTDPWWRQVILLASGYLSSFGRRRLNEWIQTIIDASIENERDSYYQFFLAIDCIGEAGIEKINQSLLVDIVTKLKNKIKLPLDGSRETILKKLAAENALNRVQTGKITSVFWRKPVGEPEWITIPVGKFWMGNGNSVCSIHLPEFKIASVPITNAQYNYFVRDTGYMPPKHWRGGHVPRGLESHPVVNITYYDAIKYCQWLSFQIDKNIDLPTESQWEKAARGGIALLDYPWGTWEDYYANTQELGIADTIPVGLITNGASPYGVLDMSGNVWEWTKSNWSFHFPYLPENVMELRINREQAPIILRGGSFKSVATEALCSNRQHWSDPTLFSDDVGFRVIAY